MHDDDDVYDHLALERETENGGVCAKKRVSTKAVVLIATDCTQPLTVKSELRHWEVEVSTRGSEEGKVRPEPGLCYWPCSERKVGFTENTVMRHRRGG